MWCYGARAFEFGLAADLGSGAGIAVGRQMWSRLLAFVPNLPQKGAGHPAYNLLGFRSAPFPVLFRSVLLCFGPFCSVLFCSVLFGSAVLFCSGPLCRAAVAGAGSAWVE